MWRSDTAIKALQANATAWKTFTGASSLWVRPLQFANLASGYADMTAVAASQVAMAAVCGGSSSQVAMAARTKAIAASQTALNAIAGSTTALDALYAKRSRLTGAKASKSGKFIILEISSDSAFIPSRYLWYMLLCLMAASPVGKTIKGNILIIMQ